MDESSLLLPENPSDRSTRSSNGFLRREAIILYALLLFFALSNPFYVPAINKILDDAIQSRQGSQDHFNSTLTSILRDDRQRELALIRGTQGFLDNAVGAAVSIVLALVRSRMLPQRVFGWFGSLDSCEKVLRLSLLGLFLGKSLTAAFCEFSSLFRRSQSGYLWGGGGGGERKKHQSSFECWSLVLTLRHNRLSSHDRRFPSDLSPFLLDIDTFQPPRWRRCRLLRHGLDMRQQPVVVNRQFVSVGSTPGNKQTPKPLQPWPRSFLTI